MWPFPTTSAPVRADNPHSRYAWPAFRLSVFGAALLLAVPRLALASRAEFSASLRGSEQKAQGYLGIEFHDVGQIGLGMLRFHPAHQVEIVMVDHDGPAGKAGLRAHDAVQSVNGQAVASSEALRQMIHDAGAGATLTLTVLRDGHAQTLTAQLESREDVERRAWARVTVPAPVVPESDLEGEEARPSPGVSSVRGKHFLGDVLHGSSTGVQLKTMSSQLAMYFGAPPSAGLLVESVEAGSSGAAAGLAAGDVLLRADSVALHSLSDWTKRLHASKGKAVSVVVLREHHEMTFSLQQNGGHSALEWPFRF